MELFYRVMLQGRSNLCLRDKEDFKSFLDRLLKIPVSKCLLPPAPCECELSLTALQSCPGRAPPPGPAAEPCRRGFEHCRPAGPSGRAAAAPSVCSLPAACRCLPACGPQSSASLGSHIPKYAKNPKGLNEKPTKVFSIFYMLCSWDRELWVLIMHNYCNGY